MEPITPGYEYALHDFDGVADNQVLKFIQKEPMGPDSSDMRTVQHGTTNEAVLKVLIDRLTFLNAKHPCRENSIVITKLEESLMWLEKRTADRKARGVEGTHQK